MKKKILAITLCVAMLAIAIVGGTLAYFTDEHEQTNTFTAGKVGISLDEAKVKKVDDPTSDTYGDLVADGTRTTETQEYRLYPAQKVTKDPLITVDSDSEDAYVAAKITITGDLQSLIGIEGTNCIDINKVAKGGLLDGTPAVVSAPTGVDLAHETGDCIIYQAADTSTNTWTLYIFVKDIQKANDKVQLFTTLEIPEKWNNAEMAKINGMNIKVEAYATQTNGFADCFTAMTTAFETDFPFATTP